MASLPPLTDVVELTLRKRDGVLELVDAERVYARIDVSVWKGSSRVEVAGSAWAFTQAGFRHEQVVVTAEPGDEPVGKYTTSPGGSGRLTVGTTEYELRAGGGIRQRWEWSREGRSLAVFEPHRGFGKQKGTVTVTDAGRVSRDLGLLLTLAVHVDLAGQGHAGG